MLFQAVFFTSYNADTFELQDLCIQHATRPGCWRSSGRIDDVVVMADAKTLNTLPYEEAIQKHLGIETALICGTGRPRPAALVQPSSWPESELEEQRVLDAAWPDFEKANEAGPGHGRLIRDWVAMARNPQPFPRAGGKDTVQRRIARSALKSFNEK